MATTQTAKAAVRDLKDLTRLVQRAGGFGECLAALKNGRSVTIDGAWGSAAPLVSAAVGLHAPGRCWSCWRTWGTWTTSPTTWRPSPE